MVYRIYVEKKVGLQNEANGLLSELKTFLGIDCVESIRIFNRYDAENITEELFDYAVKTVFSEPQLDNASRTIDLNGATVFATEFLPGQFDQRADSAAQCVQLFSAGNRPVVKTAKVYAINGKLSEEQLNAIKKYVINPVECREADLEEKETLAISYSVPDKVAVLDGFNGYDQEKLLEFLKEYFAVSKKVYNFIIRKAQ